MPSMLLSSVRRLRGSAVGISEDPFTDTPKNNRLLSMWLMAVSGQIEKYLDRELYIQARTEYFDMASGKTKFWIKAPPITTLTSVYEDPDGLWAGDESEIDDVFSDSDAKAAIIPYPLEWEGIKGIRVIYTGGLAYHAVNSVWTVSASKSFVAGRYIIGGTSNAVGWVVSYSGTTLTVENYYGIFQAGETITQHAQENGSDATSETDTITSIDRTSLAEGYPDIVQACEMQIGYMRRHTTDIENRGTNKDGKTTRVLSPRIAQRYPLLDEVRDMLNPYRNIALL